MQTPTTSSTSPQPQPVPLAWIERLLDKMLLDYGKRFVDQWGGVDPDKLVAHWSRELAGFTTAELKRGHDALAGRDWPPTLPEFKRMCRPAVDGTAAYYEAVAGVNARDRGEMGVWSHPAIFWAAAKLSHDLKAMTYGSVKERWEMALRAELDKGEWPAIPVPALALPAPEKSATSREEAARMLAELNAKGTVKKAEGKHDYRAWIPRVLERAKRKDSSLPAISIRFAKEAMKVDAK